MHAGDPGVFIRNMATRGHLGGLASDRRRRELLDAAGRDCHHRTVGVGRAESTSPARPTSAWSRACRAPGRRQALKAGIMEIADIFVVNKADH
jgi:LAO/AO transport system kinase